MQLYKRREKTDKSDSTRSGYAMGAGIRRAIEGKTHSIGKDLNSFQHKIGIRTTSVVIGFLWLAAFFYFAHLLLTLIR